MGRKSCIPTKRLSKEFKNTVTIDTPPVGNAYGNKEAMYMEMLGVVYDYFTNLRPGYNWHDLKQLNQELFDILDEYFDDMEDYYFQKEIQKQEKNLFDAVECYFNDLEQVHMQFAVEKLESGVKEAVSKYFDEKRYRKVSNNEETPSQEEVVEAVYGYFCEFQQAKHMHEVERLKKDVKTAVRAYLVDRQQKHLRKKSSAIEDVLMNTVYSHFDNGQETFKNAYRQQNGMEECQNVCKIPSNILPRKKQSLNSLSALLAQCF